jgi:hypothetical protein
MRGRDRNGMTCMSQLWEWMWIHAEDRSKARMSQRMRTVINMRRNNTVGQAAAASIGLAVRWGAAETTLKL